jgi:hypothetical protein
MTVDFPEPEPPAIPTMYGLTASTASPFSLQFQTRSTFGSPTGLGPEMMNCSILVNLNAPQGEQLEVCSKRG